MYANSIASQTNDIHIVSDRTPRQSNSVRVKKGMFLISASIKYEITPFSLIFVSLLSFNPFYVLDVGLHADD